VVEQAKVAIDVRPERIYNGLGELEYFKALVTQLNTIKIITVYRGTHRLAGNVSVGFVHRYAWQSDCFIHNGWEV
jgi:hypothetical protein